jgi:hypothetical protein
MHALIKKPIPCFFFLPRSSPIQRRHLSQNPLSQFTPIFHASYAPVLLSQVNSFNTQPLLSQHGMAVPQPICPRSAWQYVTHIAPQRYHGAAVPLPLTRGAGPRIFLPVASYWEPWHGHLNLFSACKHSSTDDHMGHLKGLILCTALRVSRGASQYYRTAGT